MACAGATRPSSSSSTASVMGISTPSARARASSTGALGTPSGKRVFVRRSEVVAISKLEDVVDE